MSNATPLVLAVIAAELVPAAAFAFAAESIAQAIAKLAAPIRILLPAVLVLPYALIAISQHRFRWDWCAMYFGLPVVIAWLLLRAAKVDPEQKGDWRDALVLLVLGLSVDLRWFDPAWPRGQEGLGKIILVDAGLYGFLAIRQLQGSGYNLRLRWSDWKTGLRELIFFAPFVLLLGLALGFLSPHKNLPSVFAGLLRWIEIFIFVALPEELFFRTWIQNLLEHRMGRWAALIAASIIFGLSHFNKRNLPGAHFNWRYVLLASIAGIFYGRAWREHRRVAASTITHTFVDWLWSWWF
jgi:membrane protease YdiL (CAAX protease family)